MTITAEERLKERVYTTRDTCRLCGSKDLVEVWSAGETPLANSYVTPEEVARHVPEAFAPLRVFSCRTCYLIQLRDVVNPDALFRQYLYVSSTSPSFVKHFEDYANHLRQRFHLTRTSLVIDVGSNDGVLLRPLQQAEIRVLGIDPAENLAAEATAKGIFTLPEYFSPPVASRVLREHGPAAVIAANNVFAHTDGIDTFLEAVKTLLAPDGVYVFEVQYLRDLVEKNLFDIVYHEHVNYYHLTPLVSYMEKHGMEVFDVQRVPVHGGSIRVFVQRQGGTHPRSETVARMMGEEALTGLNDLSVYQTFAMRIAENGKKLRALLQEIRASGKRVVGYGAPAKATTLMYAFGLTGNDLEYIVDDAPLKQGRLMPGTHVPIVSSEQLYADKPDYCLILAWNFADQIREKHRGYAADGRKFIVPVPEPRILADL